MKALKLYQKALLGIAFFMLCLCSAEAKLKDQQLAVGRAITLQTNYGIGDVALTDQSVVDYIVRNNRREIYLNPLKEGRVTLTIWNTEDKVMDTITINVVSVSIDSLLKELQERLKNISGVTVKLVDNQNILLSGEANSISEMETVTQISEKYPQVRSHVTLSNRVIQVMANRIQKAINTPGIRVRPIRGTLVLEGVTYSQDAYKKAETIAHLYDEKAVNLIEIRPGQRRPGEDKTVKLDVYFMEVKNSAIRSFGINWAPGSTVQGAAESGSGGQGAGATLGLVDLNAILGFVFNLLPKIKWMHETNRGRVLEKPSFLVKSGEAINFYSGTQIPYFSQGSVTFKEVGIRVNAEPIATDEDVDLKIKVNVSSPSASISKGIDTSEIETTAFIKSGQSIVLGGLLRNNDIKSSNKVPEGTNTDTALFTLFLSQDFQTNKSQFYIFVKPTIISKPTGAETELKRWLELNDAVDKERG